MSEPTTEATETNNDTPIKDEGGDKDRKEEDVKAEGEKVVGEGDDAEDDEGRSGKLVKELDDEAPKTFPQVLMDILSNEEDSDTIAWLPHGRSFIIYKKKRFASHVLPRYFKATKFTSFTRKLNRWGFTRVTRGPEIGSYYHKLFLRDDPGLCLRMSSHSSSKYQETQQNLMPNPMQGMGFPGFFPGMMPMGMPGMNPADLSQQNQLINQQLQQLQWQQFQLQQLQQQQHQQPHHGGPPPPGMHPGHHPHGGPPPPHGPPPHHMGGPPPHMQGGPMPPQGPPGGPPGPAPPTPGKTGAEV